MYLATLKSGVKGLGCASVCALPVALVSPTIKVFVDPKSLPYIDGTELDFAREGLNEGFKFYNPNVKNECGCGESFTI